MGPKQRYKTIMSQKEKMRAKSPSRIWFTPMKGAGVFHPIMDEEPPELTAKYYVEYIALHHVRENAQVVTLSQLRAAKKEITRLESELSKAILQNKIKDHVKRCRACKRIPSQCTCAVCLNY